MARNKKKRNRRQRNGLRPLRTYRGRQANQPRFKE
jgi:hypothetical protein